MKLIRARLRAQFDLEMSISVSFFYICILKLTVLAKGTNGTLLGYSSVSESIENFLIFYLNIRIGQRIKEKNHIVG